MPSGEHSERLLHTARSQASSYAPYLAITLLVTLVFAQWLPNGSRSFLRFDSGLFLYVAEQMQRGAVLYRDVWDHKPPLIFYLNELGLALGSGSPRGVLCVECCLVLVFFALLYRTVKLRYGTAIATFVVPLGLLLFLDVTPHPNLGEVVSLPLQALSMVLLFQELEQTRMPVYAALQGAIGATLFWIRPNGIAVSLVYLAAIVLTWRREAIRSWAVFLSGAAAITAIVLAPLALRVGLDEIWFASFGFNQLYAGLATWTERAHAAAWMIFEAGRHGAILPALAALLALPFLPDSLPAGRKRIRWLIAAWFVLEVLFAAYTGKLYGKNIVPWLAPGTLLTAELAAALFRTGSDKTRTAVALYAASAVCCWFVAFGAVAEIRENQKALPNPDVSILREIRVRSKAGERVTFWGEFSPETIWHADRPTGTRFFSSVPLSHGRAIYIRLAPVALADLLHHRPKLIAQRQDGRFPTLFHIAARDGSTGPYWDNTALDAAKRELEQLYAPVWCDKRANVTLFQLARPVGSNH